PDGEHADDAARAEGDLHGLVRDLRQIRGGLPLLGGGLTSGRGHSYVAAHRKPHADIAGGGGESGAYQEEQRTSYTLVHVIGGQQEQQEEDDYGENAEGAQLAGKIGVRAFLHGSSDLLHAVGALARGEYLTDQHDGDAESCQGDQGDHDDETAIASGQHGIGEVLVVLGWAEVPRHSSSLTLGAGARGSVAGSCLQRCGRIVGISCATRQGTDSAIRLRRRRSNGVRVRNSLVRGSFTKMLTP